MYSRSVITVSYWSTVSDSLRIELYAKQQCFHSASSHVTLPL